MFTSKLYIKIEIIDILNINNNYLNMFHSNLSY